MRHWRPVTWLAAALLGGGLVWVHAAQEAAYKGSKACVLCHRNTDKAIVESWAKGPHAFALPEASDETIVADFANAPFDRARIKYVLGQGTVHGQAYMDENWQVLPGTWLTQEKKWVPLETVDGKAQCVRCHVTGFDVETMKWVENKVACEACHGPGSLHMTNPKGETIARLAALKETDPQRAAMVCGQCHSAGKDPSGKYHYPVGYKPGEDLAQYFVDAKPTAPGFNQQYSELIQSPKHWENGVVCTTCHDPHNNTDQPHMLLKPVNELCAGCHAGMADLAAHAQGKGVQAAEGATCATCHMPNGQHLFDKSIVPQG